LDEEDRTLAHKALEFADKIVKDKKPHLLVLDEISLALYCGLLDIREVTKFLDTIPTRTDVVLTGRYASKELIDRADFVNEVVDIKYPRETVTTKGIQY
jgi:cob(I)alamin adenosyltransferase